MNQQEQNKLLKSLCRHEPAAQRKFLQEYGDMVYGLILRLVGNALDAEEVYQDVFLKALSHIDKYNQATASIEVWLRRIAYNSSLNHLRHLQHTHLEFTPGDEMLTYTADSKASNSDDEETIELMTQALELLPPTDKTLITMFYYDNMSFSEIAYVTDLNVSTIGSRLFRIRKKLYGIIKEIEKHR